MQFILFCITVREDFAFKNDRLLLNCNVWYILEMTSSWIAHPTMTRRQLDCVNRHNFIVKTKQKLCMTKVNIKMFC